MRTMAALLRASWLTQVSYRVQTAMTFLTLWVTVVPVYFFSRALQPLMADAIRGEGDGYFTFMLSGAVAITVVSTCVTALPAAVQGGIGSGFFESLLMTRASRGAIAAGIGAYPILWALFRGFLMLLAGAAFGARFHASGVLPALLIVGLLVVVHWAIGLIAAAMIVAWRTAGPLATAVVVASTLLGGAYYPPQRIPIPWIQDLSVVVPLQYGLRALRRVLFGGAPFADVMGDVVVVAAFAVVLTALGYGAFLGALSYARRRGSLSYF